MTGMVVPLMEQRQLNFSYLQCNTAETLTLHAALPVAGYKSGLLMIRVHEGVIGETATFLFGLYPTLPCNTDGRQFANISLAVAEVKVTKTDVSPAYLHSPILILDAAHLLVQVQAIQGAKAGGLAAQLSAELLLREE